MRPSLLVLALLLAAGFSPALRAAESAAPLTRMPLTGFTALFNGRDTTGWHFSRTVHHGSVGKATVEEGAIVLRQYGGDIYVADLVGLAMVREMGAVMTAVVLAAGLGSVPASAVSKFHGIGFTKGWDTPVARQNESCLGCHKGGNRLHWPGSAHAGNQLGCADCHNPMEKVSANSLLVRATINETCETCHQQQRTEFNKRSHMPLHEGKMTCVDCHNPHARLDSAAIL